MLKNLADELILFGCCLAAFFTAPGPGAGVVPVILAVIFVCLLIYFENDGLRLALTLAFLVLCVFLPALVFFLPPVCSQLSGTRYRYFSFLAVLPVIILWPRISLASLAEIAVLFAVSVWFRFCAGKIRRLTEERNTLRDSGRELSLRLGKQNRDLMEQQDAEISVAMLGERNRIAREIHDSVGHSLSSALLQVGALLTVSKEEKTRGGLLDLKETLTEAMNGIRASVHDLHDESVDLYEQIFRLARGFTFCRVDFEYGFETDPDVRLKYAFIAIVKEALTNVARHSDADCVRIRFCEHPALYQLIVSDNGTVKDFDPDGGIGLKNIAERVETFRGNLNLSTQHGFELFISIPKEGART